MYKKQTFNSLLDRPVGTVQVGMDKKPICIPGKAMLTVPGNTTDQNIWVRQPLLATELFEAEGESPVVPQRV